MYLLNVCRPLFPFIRSCLKLGSVSRHRKTYSIFKFLICKLALQMITCIDIQYIKGAKQFNFGAFVLLCSHNRKELLGGSTYEHIFYLLFFFGRQ